VRESPWTQTSPGCWDAHVTDLAERLGSEVYSLDIAEGTFRFGGSRSIVWDCPRCERRLRLTSHWNHTEPCGGGFFCLCIGWQAECACGALVRIATEALGDPRRPGSAWE
jgi:hypothetical protein